MGRRFGCQCGTESKERKERAALREKGLCYGTVYALQLTLRQLKNAGMPMKVAETLLRSMHNTVMEHLDVVGDWSIVLSSKKHVWRRRAGWIES